MICKHTWQAAVRGGRQDNKTTNMEAPKNITNIISTK
jgi:hypothetical protein